MTLWDAILMVLSFFGSPIMVVAYAVVITFLGIGTFATAREVADEDPRIVIPWCAFGVILILFAASLLTWVVSGSTDPVSW